MTPQHPDVALLTDRRYTSSVATPDDWYLSNILRDDELVQAALLQIGLTSTRIDWANSSVDWSKFRCAVFRTTWDYFERLPQFTAWLEQIQLQTRLCNDASTVRWNLDKHYLIDLKERGIPVVPSRFIERGSDTSLSNLLDATDWDEAVIKPCVSGAARNTYRVNRREC